MWKPITIDFDRTKPVTKYRFHTDVALTYGRDNNYYFSELPNINTNGRAWDYSRGPEWGYATENRGTVNLQYFCNRIDGINDRKWDQATQVAANTYVYELPSPVYWSGMHHYTDTRAISDLTNSVDVWVPGDIILDETAITFTLTGGTETVHLTADFPWTASTTDNWISFAPTTGDSGTTTISITLSPIMFEGRTGTITFTDTEGSTAELSVIQTGMGGRVPNKKLYKGDRRLN